jgi:hypothetical protein
MTAPTQDAIDGLPCVDAFACEAPAVARALAVDPASGITEDEAVRRRARVGDNTVPTEPPRSLVRSVVAELRETMILVLLVARAGLVRSGKGPKSHQRCPLSGRSGPVDACLVGPIRPIVGGESRPNDRDKGCT